MDATMDSSARCVAAPPPEPKPRGSAHGDVGDRAKPASAYLSMHEHPSWGCNEQYWKRAPSDQSRCRICEDARLEPMPTSPGPGLGLTSRSAGTAVLLKRIKRYQLVRRGRRWAFGKEACASARMTPC
jgi:hypothetical protein